MADAKEESGAASASLSRRRFITTVAAAGLALRQHGHEASPPPLAQAIPRKTIVTPHNDAADLQAQYAKAYQRLNAAIGPAASELNTFSGQFGIFDTVKLLKGFEITLLPPQGSHEGASQYHLRVPDRRSGSLPATMKLLKTCLDIQQLDDLNCTPTRDRLDLYNVAGQVVAQYNTINPHNLLNANSRHQDCYEVFRAVLNTTTAFQARGAESAREPSKTIELKLSGTIPLNIEIRNPHLRQNQLQALRAISR
jgi:hypothetical protein